MNEMIKAERNKICSRKQTRMLFLAGVVLIVAYFFFFQFNYQNVFYDYDLEKMALASGFTAIEQRDTSVMMSSTAPPGGSIGRTNASQSMAQSTRTGPCTANACFRTSLSSGREAARNPGKPNASASFTKSVLRSSVVLE